MMPDSDLIQARSCTAPRSSIRYCCLRNGVNSKRIQGPLEPSGLDKQGRNHENRAGNHGCQPGRVADARWFFADPADGGKTGAHDRLAQWRDAGLFTVRAAHHRGFLHTQVTGTL